MAEVATTAGRRLLGVARERLAAAVQSVRANIRPLYLVAALVTAGHAGEGGYVDARIDGRAVEDAVLIAVTAGVGGGAVWPVYWLARGWGLRR